MGCFVVPVSVLIRRCSRFGYRPLVGEGEDEGPVTVIVGRERREFSVDPFVLEENPFQVLIELSRKGSKRERVIFVDVDEILFEHMLWLLNNDSNSFFNLNVRDIIDFYAL